MLRRVLSACLILAACSEANEPPPADACAPDVRASVPPESWAPQWLEQNECAEEDVVLSFMIMQTTFPPPLKGAEATLTAVHDAVDETKAMLAPCTISVCLRRVGVVGVPPADTQVTANQLGDWGGSAPSSSVSADAFNYGLGQTIPAEVAPVLDAARKGLSPRELSLIVVDELAFYEGRQTKSAAGFAYAAVAYHAAQDVPRRNGAWLATSFKACEGSITPLGDRLLTHELGHLLLNTGEHESDKNNVMSDFRGPEITGEQCDRMRGNIDTLLVDPPLVDPGPP